MSGAGTAELLTQLEHAHERYRLLDARCQHLGGQDRADHRAARVLDDARLAALRLIGDLLLALLRADPALLAALVRDAESPRPPAAEEAPAGQAPCPRAGRRPQPARA